jgi:hypothetical protein
MLRAIIRRKVRHTSGAEFELFRTIDFNCDALQLALQDGGFGEHTFDFTELVGIECVDHICERSDEVQNDN